MLARGTTLSCIAALGCLWLVPASADEGAWTFEEPPRAVLAAKYGFAPAVEWLAELRLATLHMGGASGAFVSGAGLAVTNYHVVRGCVQRLSTPDRDLVRDGFLARARSEERPCPGFEVRRLESVEDVTDRLRAAVDAADAPTANAQRNAAIGAIERACNAATGLSCEIEALFRGARYRLLRYRTWHDVRLVFAPEASVGLFGGDPDNFVYPRFDLDVAFVRLYENGQPAPAAHFLRWSPRGAAAGDLVFAAGHPYETNRLVTAAQLTAARDVLLPRMIDTARRQRAMLQEFGARSPESARRAGDHLFGTENWLKGMLGEAKSLADPAVPAAKANEEARLRAAWGERASGVDPWARIAGATQKRAAAFDEIWYVNYGYRTLFDHAGRIVEIANERGRPDAERLADYRESAIARLTLRLLADEPAYRDLEIARLANNWEQARDVLGAEHPFVRLVLQGGTPLARATELIEASTIDRAAERKRLLDGGLAAVNASTDPLVMLAREVYGLHRRVALMEEEIDEIIRAAADEIARTRFAVLGSGAYPDATGSLRLSYGTVRGYDADGVLTPWRTNFWGLYARRAAFDGRPPFDLPARWLERQRDLPLDTTLNFVATLDITGGNSGSPVIDRRRELVGLVFDGNLESLGWRYAYTEEKARAVVVDARAIVDALRSVYDARALVGELLGNDAAPGAATSAGSDARTRGSPRAFPGALSGSPSPVR